jgi:hypothetical protein
MTQKEDLAKLRLISDLMLEMRLARLTAAAHAKQQSEDQLAGLARTSGLTVGIQPVAAQLAALNYQRWAESRRAEINLVLARQTAEWIDARDAARTAFGRAEVVGKLQQRLWK